MAFTMAEEMAARLAPKEQSQQLGRTGTCMLKHHGGWWRQVKRYAISDVIEGVNGFVFSQHEV